MVLSQFQATFVSIRADFFPDFCCFCVESFVLFGKKYRNGAYIFMADNDSGDDFRSKKTISGHLEVV